MSESEFFFHLFYILFVASIIYPPSEFVGLGLTVEKIFDKFLGNESIQFIQYHIRRTVLIKCVHSLLPIAYVILYDFNYWDAETFDKSWKTLLWNTISFFAAILPFLCGLTVWSWSKNNWRNHPICITLTKFSNCNTRWQGIAEDINTEYRRDDKIRIKINSIYTVIATENWVIKTTPYNVYFAHQSDTALIADKADTHVIGQDSADWVQFVNIQVKPTRSGVKNFTIRINALDFRELQDRITRPIAILSSVQFNQSAIERWIQVFKQQIELNPRHTVEASQIGESCFACMAAEPNVKLIKQCEDVGANGQIVPEQERCGNCYCRPMWCVDCLAKWFASRQSQYEREVWLQQKCSCPMCRSMFCILDVSYIIKI